MAWEVSHVGALFQIPNLNLGVGRASAKNETIRVELSTRESYGVQTGPLLGDRRLLGKWSIAKPNTDALTTTSTLISNFSENSTSLDIGEGPVLQNDATKSVRRNNLT